MTKEKETALITIDQPNAAAVFVAGGLDPFIQRIKDEFTGIVGDLSTVKGRQVYKNMNRRIREHKADFSRAGKALVKQLKSDRDMKVFDYNKKIEEVTKERERMENELTNFAVEMRQPLTELEDAEKREKERLDALVCDISKFEEAIHNCELSGQIDSVLIHLKQLKITTEVYKAAYDDAVAEKQRIIDRLTERRDLLKEKEDVAAEKKRLRKEEEERKRRERKAEIEKKAQKDAEKAAEEKNKKEQERLIREKWEADMKAEKAEKKAEKAEKKAKEIKEELKELKSDPRISKSDSVTTGVPPRTAAGNPSEEHKKKVKQKIETALLKLNFTPENARKLVIMVGLGKIPHLKIEY